MIFDMSIIRGISPQVMWAAALAVAIIIGLVMKASFYRAQIIVLITQARYKFRMGILTSGKEQEDWVVKMCQMTIPSGWQVIFTESVIRWIVKWVFHQVKDFVDDGKLNDSIA